MANQETPIRVIEVYQTSDILKAIEVLTEVVRVNIVGGSITPTGDQANKKIEEFMKKIA